jgi:hypothetical protein
VRLSLLSVLEISIKHYTLYNKCAYSLNIEFILYNVQLSSDNNSHKQIITLGGDNQVNKTPSNIFIDNRNVSDPMGQWKY